MGVVGKDYGNHALPGWRGGTVGYHVDDGKIFDAANPTKGVEYEGKSPLSHFMHTSGVLKEKWHRSFAVCVENCAKIVT